MHRTPPLDANSAGQQAEDPSFSNLPPNLKRRIDRAFDEALANNSGVRPSKRRKTANDSFGQTSNVSTTSQHGGFLPGGFIVDEPGGFIVDSSPPPGSVDSGDSPAPAKHSDIPLSLIPAALQLLDLQPDDEDVLSVFRNAASGWTDASGVQSSVPDPHVSRQDWRAVCAALLGTGADEPERMDDDAESDGQDIVEDDSDPEEEYMDSGSEHSKSSAELADSDDEYVEGGFIPSKGKGKTRGQAATEKLPRGGRKGLSLDDSDADEGTSRARPLTARQKQECRRAFGLFFPNVRDDKLDDQRIMIKDITRVAKLLKEKLSAEEIMEMLDAFSSSADRSMNLQDFERMMIAAKLA
ncbi:uncharacterized protein FIBRA_09402 [Fibroporia radiculosa]|uniref:EF-hand domain-containing protein n=1 Tax=Fibroporia radiculosa TaxID=599839 RepID=J7SD05_9APHY|nr:uncharacterized protein FIBRA_09402 [Fibroporia radiculosa]CCM07078.1 predicted protein [Fibroporia radiculosa]